MSRTKLMITCKCSKCQSIYMACMIYGGIPIDSDTTNTIAEAYIKGDKVELLDNARIEMGECSCLPG